MNVSGEMQISKCYSDFPISTVPLGALKGFHLIKTTRNSHVAVSFFECSGLRNLTKLVPWFREQPIGASKDTLKNLIEYKN